MRWFRYFEGEELSDRCGKYSFWFKRGLATMSVDRVKPDDSGTYMCVATNSIGSCSTLGELNVQGETACARCVTSAVEADCCWQRVRKCVYTYTCR